MPVILAREAEARGLAIQGHEFKASLGNSRPCLGKGENGRKEGGRQGGREEEREGGLKFLGLGPQPQSPWHFLFGSPHPGSGHSGFFFFVLFFCLTEPNKSTEHGTQSRLLLGMLLTTAGLLAGAALVLGGNSRAGGPSWGGWGWGGACPIHHLGKSPRQTSADGGQTLNTLNQ